MSDTPITDSAAWNPQGTDVWQVVVPVDTSRKLERMCAELAEASANLRKWAVHLGPKARELQGMDAALARYAAMKKGGV